jgi:type II secretory pathway pseudopilin PulG
MAILGILATGLILALNPAAQIKKANDAKRKSDLSQIQKAVETYYNDFGHYPTSTASKALGLLGWGYSWDPYMSILPADPSASKQYAYCSLGEQSYYLYASLDIGGNNPANFASGGCLASSCGGTCNYGLSSPNVSP